jgi:hypothetical protein
MFSLFFHGRGPRLQLLLKNNELAKHLIDVRALLEAQSETDLLEILDIWTDVYGKKKTERLRAMTREPMTDEWRAIFDKIKSR